MGGCVVTTTVVLYDTEIGKPQEEIFEIDANLLRFEELLGHAKELGLTGQVQMLVIQIGELERKKRKVLNPILSDPLTDSELAVWCEWLPTAYRENPNPDNLQEGDIKDYRFDLIPADISERWAKLRQMGAFDEFVIRTPERWAERVRDPILLGIRDGKHYLLARWAESDASLVSFAEIQSRVVDRLTREYRSAQSIQRGSSFIALCGLISILVPFLANLGNTSAALWVLGGFAFLLGGSLSRFTRSGAREAMRTLQRIG